ncbi:MAG: DNA repair exonuclease [Clostridiaceae bacterium]|jgi:exonuclease SbcD|nr:DNA repair exonuclease [Clostridiaceae bacterium]
MRVRMLQFGDLHMDAPFTSLSDMEGRPSQRRLDLKNVLARLMDLAISEKADLVLVCGDLYEHGYTGKSSIHYICSQLARLPGTPVLIIPGNHDPILPGSYYSEYRWPPNVHILESGDIFMHPETNTRVYAGLDHGPTSPDFINILMHHGTLDMPFDPDAFQPVSSVYVEEKGFDYCALGHFHSRITAGGARGIFYNAGSPEPLGFDEPGDHGAFITEIVKEPGGKASVHAEFITVCARRCTSLTADVSGCLSSGQATDVIAAEMDAAGQNSDLFRITLTGRLPSGVQIDTEEIFDRLKEIAFYLKITDRTRPDYDLEAISRERGLRGLFTRKMLERASLARGEEAEALVMKALYYGLEAIDEGKVCI